MALERFDYWKEEEEEMKSIYVITAAGSRRGEKKASIFWMHVLISHFLFSLVSFVFMALPPPNKSIDRHWAYF